MYSITHTLYCNAVTAFFTIKLLYISIHRWPIHYFRITEIVLNRTELKKAHTMNGSVTTNSEQGTYASPAQRALSLSQQGTYATPEQRSLTQSHHTLFISLSITQ